jgi:toxin FitB
LRFRVSASSLSPPTCPPDVFLLDTNVVSEMRKGQRSHPGVKAWSDGVADTDCHLSAVTLFELRLGALLKHRRDQAQGAVLLRWIGAVQASFAGRILDVAVDDWMRCADLHVPTPRSLRDSLIGAGALNRGLTIVTRNTGDFDGLGVPLVNPWET